MKRLLLPVLLLIATTSIAQPYIDSFDINTGSGFNNSSLPSNLVADGSTLYFAANDGVHGKELWVLYANETAPKRITDIRPDSISSLANGFNNIAVLNGWVYFSAADTSGGWELWSFDGNGTVNKAADIDTGFYGGNPQYLVGYNNKLYFSARTAANGTELWQYDPSTKQASITQDLREGPQSGFPTQLTVFNGKIYFVALDTAYGSEIFSLDPSTNTVSLVADINTGSAPSNPTALTVIDNKLYFFARSAAEGNELYEYDGTAAPKRVTDMNPGTGSGAYTFAGIVKYNGGIYFNGYDVSNSNYQLAKYDPSSGTASIALVVNANNTASIRDMVAYGGNLFYSVNDGTTGLELWKYDGSTQTMVADLYPGLQGSNPDNLTVAGTNMYFSARAFSIGAELFRYSDFPLSIEEARSNANIKVYPNPTTDILHINIKPQNTDTYNILLTDITGKTVYEVHKELRNNTSYTISIPTNNLPAGTYIYKIKSSGNSSLSTGKVIK